MKKLRQTLAVLMAVVMLVSVIPFAVNAEGTDVSFVLSKVNDVPYTGTAPITSGSSIAVDVVLRRSASDDLQGWLLGYSFDESALTFDGVDYAPEWDELSDPDIEQTENSIIGAVIALDAELTATEFTVATIHFNIKDDFTGVTAINAGVGEKNYFCIWDEVNEKVVTKDDLAFEGCQFEVFANVDKSELLAQLNTIATLEEMDYTPNTWRPYAQAVAAGQLVYDNAYATQNEVDDAVSAIASAYNSLIEVAEKMELFNKIDEAEEEAGKTEVYKPESIAALNALIVTAQAVYDDDNATQDEVNAQVAALTAGIKALEKNEVVVTFRNYDGSTFTTVKVRYGDNVEIPADVPTKPSNETYNYVFSRWEGTFENITEPVNIDPVFTESFINYEVKFFKEDGITQIGETQTYHYNETITPPAAPEKPQDAQYTYTFSGWTPILAPVTADAEYTATYSSELRSYKVTFLNEDGTLYEEGMWDYGKTPSVSANPTKENTAQYTYTFSGWDTEIAPVTGDATYTATFSSSTKSYVIVFLDEDGTKLSEQELEYGATVTEPAAPEKPADVYNTYAFAGWSPAVAATVSGSATYTATYTATPIEYTIIFQDDDGTQIGAVQKLNYGAEISVPANPSKEATAQYTYTFSGWSPALEMNVKGDATYTATYNAAVNSYKVTFLNEDGTLYEEGMWDYGKTPSVSANPTKEATAQYTYTFAGWDTEIAPVTGEATYKAVFDSTVNTYTVTFYNGEEVFATADYEYGQTPTNPAGTPEKASDATYYYTFKGWTPAYSEVTGAASYTAEFESHYLPADYTEVDAKIAEAKTYLEKADDYTSTSYNRLFAAVAAVEKGKTIDEQGTVNNMAKAIDDAIKALVSDKEYISLYEYAAGLNNNNNAYDVDSFEAFTAKFAAIGGQKDFDTEEATQADVQAEIELINAALSELKAATLTLEGEKKSISDVETLTFSNTTIKNTLLKANDGGANTAEICFYDAQGNAFTSETLRIGTGFRVDVVQNGSVQISKNIVVYGDINGDGLVNLIDIRLVKQMALSTEGFSDEQILAAKCGGEDIDVNAVIALALAI